MIPPKTSAFTFAMWTHLCYLLFCGKFIFCVHMELCKQTENPAMTVVVQLVWKTPHEQNTWLLMRQILSRCAFSKTPGLCYQKVRLMALVLPLQSASFWPLSWGPLYSSFSSWLNALQWGSESHGKLLQCWWHLVALKRYMLRFLPLLASALLNAPGVISR